VHGILGRRLRLRRRVTHTGAYPMKPLNFRTIYVFRLPRTVDLTYTMDLYIVLWDLYCTRALDNNVLRYVSRRIHVYIHIYYKHRIESCRYTRTQWREGEGGRVVRRFLFIFSFCHRRRRANYYCYYCHCRLRLRSVIILTITFYYYYDLILVLLYHRIAMYIYIYLYIYLGIVITAVSQLY